MRALAPALLALCILTPGLSHADAPASIPEGGRDMVKLAFDGFAARWMAKARESEQQNRENPSVQAGAAAPLITYRGYGDDYAIELRPTGNPTAPYVGLLRYTEHVYSCSGVEATECSIVSSVPITEIFRYQQGRWHY